jgi:integrase
VRPITASRTRQRIEAVIDFASKSDLRDSNSANPATLRSLPLGKQAKTVTHHRALAFSAIGEFMVPLRGLDSVSARSLEFCILTAARSNEIVGAEWSEIDWNSAMWVIPPARMKGGREHRVALSTAALELLRNLPRDGGPYIFFGGPGKPLGGGAMRAVLKQLGHDTRTNVHGFRSTFRDWAAERTGFAREIIELALAHKVAAGTEAAFGAPTSSRSVAS